MGAILFKPPQGHWKYAVDGSVRLLPCHSLFLPGNEWSISALLLISANEYCSSQGSNVNQSWIQFSPTVNPNFCIATMVISNMYLSQLTGC